MIYKENRNRLSLLNRNKRKGVIGIAGKTPIPLTIPDIFLWFNDDTLVNPSSNNFVWTDKVSGVISLQGEFGSGSGIQQVNGYNVLNSSTPTTFSNQLTGGTFPLTNEITHICFFTNFTTVGRSCQLIRQGNPGLNTQKNYYYRSFNLRFIKQDNINTFPIGFNNQSGLKLCAYTLEIGSMFVYLQGGAGASNLSQGIDPAQNLDFYTINHGGDNGSNNFIGTLGETIIYLRKLTSTELNKLGNYYVAKYGGGNLTWNNIP